MYCACYIFLAGFRDNPKRPLYVLAGFRDNPKRPIGRFELRLKFTFFVALSTHIHVVYIRVRNKYDALNSARRCTTIQKSTCYYIRDVFLFASKIIRKSQTSFILDISTVPQLIALGEIVDPSTFPCQHF